MLALVSGAATLASWYVYAAASDPNRTPYDLSFWRAGASVAGTALGAWFACRRSKAALPVAAATAVGTIALGTANVLRKGVYVTRTWKKRSVQGVGLVRGAGAAEDALLKGDGGFAPATADVQDTGCAEGVGQASNEKSVEGAVLAWDAAVVKEAFFNRAMPVVHAVGSTALVGASVLSAWERQAGAPTLAGPLSNAPWYPRVRKLGLLFMTFSMLGHWVEMLFCTGIKYGIFKGGYDRENHMLWDQWLFPFPAEGTAAVIADLVLVPVKKMVEAGAASLPMPARLPVALGASFLANQLACTAVDFSTGMVANRNYELWDYRDMRFNFMGQVCLQNSLFYSVAATWGVWWLLPALEKLMDWMGDTALDGVLVGMGSVFAFLELLYQVVLPGWQTSPVGPIEPLE